MNIPFSRIEFSGNEINYVTEVIQSGWLTTGPKCTLFEKEFAQKIKAPYACAVNSATAALHLAAEAVGIGPGDKVFVPTMTFTSSAEIIRYLGADPVFLDVEYGTCLITADILDRAIRDHHDCRALILVHFGGQAAEMEDILSLCRQHEIRVIEDAAHAFPTRKGSKYVGTFGDATCFSFYANKTITTGEGGMLVTNDETLYQRAKIMRLHGINREVWSRYQVKGANWEYDILAPGYKYNLTDIAAAIGLAQLEKADEYRRERQRCAEFYYRCLSDIPCLDLPICHGPLDNHSWHLYWVVLNGSSPISRNIFIEKLSEAGVGTSVHYKPLHRMSYYQTKYLLNSNCFPNAERHWKGVTTLPIYPSLTDDELAYICNCIHGLLH
jgi:dTDP-4-amino-4,6-dideoxygalactose transaminase